jgi:hypothetical protein
MLTLEPMRATDLDLVTAWLDAPEVARWYLVGSTIAEEIDELHRCIVGVEPTRFCWSSSGPSPPLYGNTAGGFGAAGPDPLVEAYLMA